MRTRDTIFSAATFLALCHLSTIPWSCTDNGPPGLYATTASSDLASLLAMLRMEDADMREHAATALGKLGDPRAVIPLVSVLTQDRDAKVREHAATALGSLKDDRARLPLIEVMRNDPDPAVREHAAAAVGVTGPPGALDALREAEWDPDSDVRQWAAEAIRMIEGWWSGGSSFHCRRLGGE